MEILWLVWIVFILQIQKISFVWWLLSPAIISTIIAHNKKFEECIETVYLSDKEIILTGDSNINAIILIESINYAWSNLSKCQTKSKIWKDIMSSELRKTISSTDITSLYTFKGPASIKKVTSQPTTASAPFDSRRVTISQPLQPTPVALKYNRCWPVDTLLLLGTWQQSDFSSDNMHRSVQKKDNYCVFCGSNQGTYCLWSRHC